MTDSARAGAAPLAGTAAVALGFRFLYFRQLRETPAFLEPVLDGAAHLEWAKGLLAGTWPPAEAFFRAPGYVAWLAAELAVLRGNPVAVAVLQLGIGALTAVLTAALAGRLFGRTAAWIGGAGAAVYPLFPFFEGQLLAPVLALPLTLAAALLSLAAMERGGAGRAGVAGLVWGLVAVVRPPVLLAGLLLPLFLGRGRRAEAVVALAGLLAFPLLVTGRNVAAGDPAFIASQGGLNFYLGNHAAANGMSATFPDAPSALGYRMVTEARRLAEADAGRPLRSAEVSAHWRGRALADIGADPGRWAGLLVKKAVLFWGAREIPNNHDPVLFAQHVPVLRWVPGWALWAPLGVVGFALGWRRRGVRFAAAVVLAVMAGCVLFFVNARFRIPAAPFLIALGGGAAAEIVRRVRAGGPRAALAPLGAVAALSLVVRWNPYGVPEEPWVVSYLLVAEAEAARQENVRALRWVDRALEIEPNLYAGRVAQIDLLRRTGRVPEARALAQRAVDSLPDDAALRTQYGALLELSGEPAAALEQLEIALRLDPTYDPAHVHRAIILARTGEWARAADLLRAFLRDRPGSAEAARAADMLRAIEAGELGPD